MKNIECLLKIILRFRKTLCVVMCVMAVFTICFESVFILNLSNRGTWVKADVSSRNLKYDTAPLQQCQRNKVLAGGINITGHVTVDEVKNDTVLSRVQKGGSYKPRDCQPVDRVAIIIPYRDRKEHLAIFLNYMHAFLQRQQLQYGIFVAELAPPTTFNRGVLVNIGFLAAQSTGLYNCYVIHDVDLLPLDDRNTYNCSNQFRHLSVANTKFGNSLPDPYAYNYVGGVLAVKEATFMNMNGFSNLYFGWGSEDDDVGIRAKLSGFKLERPHKTIGRYQALPHGNDKLSPINPNRHKLIKGAKGRWRMEGLNSLNYQLLSYNKTALYTHVYVSVNKSEVSKTDVKLIINGVKIYESDLLTIRNRGRINTKIIDAYFYLLQKRSNGTVFSVTSMFKFLKNPEFPKGSNSSSVEFMFIPLRISGHWCLINLEFPKGSTKVMKKARNRSQYSQVPHLTPNYTGVAFMSIPQRIPGHWSLIVIHTKQQTASCFGPDGMTGSAQKKEYLDYIRRIYHNQFRIDLQERENDNEGAKFPDKYDSGLLSMMFANALLEGKLLSVKQVDIGGAKSAIESTLRRQ